MENPFDFSGKSVVLTGALGGLGRPIVEAFAEAGADVALCARNKEALGRAEEDLKGCGCRFVAAPVDLCVQEQVEAFIKAFPLPEVPTVAELPQYQSWAVQLDRLCDKVQARSGLRLYPKQFEDVSRLAVQRQIALLYEQGGGVCPESCWYEGQPQTVTAVCL